MLEPLPVLRSRLDSLRDSALEFFDQTIALREAAKVELQSLSSDELERDLIRVPGPREFVTSDSWQRVSAMRSDLRRVMVATTDSLRRSPLIGEADIRDLARYSRTMDAALEFKQYRRCGVHVHHDEGVILGVDPPGQEEDDLKTATEAQTLFKDAYESVRVLLDYGSNEEFRDPESARRTVQKDIRTYRPNTAFIIMWIDSSEPYLNDVRDTIQSVFRGFNINATRSDEIEHEGKITDRILKEIAASEFLFADLTGERPSVYYEVGFAHAIGKHPILYHKKGSRIHFDLKDYNCPDYESLADLRSKLTKRLTASTNRKNKDYDY